MPLHKNLLAAIVLPAPFLLYPPGAWRAQTAPEAVSRIGAVDESTLATLKGNHHPLATAANDLGEAAPDLPMERMLLVLTRDAATESELRNLLARQQDKSSPDFHAWLSPAQFGERFGASKADLQKLTAWLASHGFRVNRVAQGAMTIAVSRTAGQLTEAFHPPI